VSSPRMDFGMDDDKLERESSCGSTVYFDSMDYMGESEALVVRRA
jgi:hypothetical protein